MPSLLLILGDLIDIPPDIMTVGLYCRTGRPDSGSENNKKPPSYDELDHNSSRQLWSPAEYYPYRVCHQVTVLAITRTQDLRL